ncbi:IS630 family transposase [Wolbachia endosymbiont of Frankliniella intonsa]|uniref:IS630 family transposase n=1 Tax=Wolbachia endosymbiont of Frankliniella intonsa TaxID=2902422 RepID=UPI00244E766B|nr:IS630 family transposase [Wolbachia endosymbiont of Frankliniella intonsa]WGJ62749.1 IS630 family transposase [Wolbachia endosymbiont of Frankliniella intonsa]
MEHSSILYIDEAGVDNKLYREYGRAPRGKKIYADVPGRTRERISIVAGWIGMRFIAPMTFKGGCEKEVFNILLEKMLLPKLPLGTTIVMDNATFHKTTKTKSLIESFGFHVLYLPTYSPDLNPIEHCWHTIKSRLRPLMYKCTDLQLLVGNTIMEIYPFILENTIDCYIFFYLIYHHHRHSLYCRNYPFLIISLYQILQFLQYFHLFYSQKVKNMAHLDQHDL